MNALTIKVSDDFSRYPAGRYKKHGKATGESFRENHLVPALKEHERVIVDFNGTMGSGSSFLEEAFGGLIREEGFSYDDLQNRLTIVSRRKSLIGAVDTHLKNAEERQQKIA